MNLSIVNSALSKNCLNEEEFITLLKDLWRHYCVYPLKEDEEPYPFEMWLKDAYDLLIMAASF